MLLRLAHYTALNYERIVAVFFRGEVKWGSRRSATFPRLFRDLDNKNGGELRSHTSLKRYQIWAVHGRSIQLLLEIERCG